MDQYRQRTGVRTFSARLTPLALSVLAAWVVPAAAQQAPSTSVSAPDASGTLPAVTVTATVVPDATTEGSGSYGSRVATIAGKTEQPLKEIPGSVSVLTRQRMDDQNITTIQGALRYVTGVESVDYGDGTAYFAARGNQLGVEFDGVSVGSGLQYLQQFDLAMYDRIEVLRGPAGVMDGVADPGGTVNLVRKRPEDAFHVSTETQIGSFGSARQMVDVTGPLNQDGSLRGRAVVVGSDALQSVDGERQKEVMAYGALDYDIDPRTTLSVSAGYQVNPINGLDYGAGGYLDSTRTNLVGRIQSAYSTNFSPSWNRAYTSMQEVNTNLEHRFENGWKAQASVFYRHELSNADYAYAGPVYTSDGYASYGDQVQRNTYDWLGLDTHATGPINLFGLSGSLTVGANYSMMTETAKSGYASLTGPGPDGTFSVYDPDTVPDVAVPYTFGTNTHLVQYGLYSQARVHLAEPLTLVLGGRLAFMQDRTQSFLPSVNDWTTPADVRHRFLPSIGLVYDVTPWLTAYANYSRFLTAQPQSLSYSGTGLPARSGGQFEMGLKGDFLNKRLSASIALFNINDNNRAVTDPNHPYYYIVGGKARDQGVELDVSGKITPNWNVYAGYTYLNVSYENASANLTDGTDPHHLFKLWTNYAFTSGVLSGASVGGGVLAQSSISRGVEQGGYAIFNAQAGYRFNKHVQASLALNNIFNRDYYIRPPGEYFSVFGARRNLMLTVRSDF